MLRWLAFWCTLLFSPVCVNAEAILVIVSANAEWREVRKLFPDARMQSGPYGEFFRTKFDGRPSVVVHGGWGKISAAASTQWAIEQFQPKLIFNLGTCSGIKGRIERFAIVSATKTVAYDILEQMGDPEAALAHYSTTLQPEKIKDPKVIRAPMLSADRDLVVEDIPKIVNKFDAVAVDWESASIAWVASRYKKPIFIFRGVSDLVGPQGGEAYGNEDHFIHGTASVMRSLFEQLPSWLAHLRQEGN
jgi:adenosylhomocysteine nucleosidase